MPIITFRLQPDHTPEDVTFFSKKILPLLSPDESRVVIETNFKTMNEVKVDFQTNVVMGNHTESPQAEVTQRLVGLLFKKMTAAKDRVNLCRFLISIDGDRFVPPPDSTPLANAPQAGSPDGNPSTSVSGRAGIPDGGGAPQAGYELEVFDPNIREVAAEGFNWLDGKVATSNGAVHLPSTAHALKGFMPKLEARLITTKGDKGRLTLTSNGLKHLSEGLFGVAKQLAKWAKDAPPKQ